ncbi:MAG: TRAP transporter TatT component family protein [Thiobacillaceae bacterium]
MMLKPKASRIRNLTRCIAAIVSLAMLAACSFSQLTVRMSQPLIDGGTQALYRESDLDLAQAAFPPNIELIEGMLVNDPGNQRLQEYAAQAYYGYAFGFVEDENPQRAGQLYRRGMEHGLRALQIAGFDPATQQANQDTFDKSVKQLDADAVAALFWTSSNLAKWIDLNRDQLDAIDQLPKAVSMMQRVLDLDERFFLAGPHIFMGVYYGGRPPLLGGDFRLAEQHFDRARTLTQHKILIIDVIQAQYFEVQRNDRDRFHKLLTGVLEAPDNLDPDQALSNAIAKRKAKRLLEQENQWF